MMKPLSLIPRLYWGSGNETKDQYGWCLFQYDIHAGTQCVVAELMCGTPNSGASSKKSPSSTACSSTDLVSAV